MKYSELIEGQWYTGDTESNHWTFKFWRASYEKNVWVTKAFSKTNNFPDRGRGYIENPKNIVPADMKKVIEIFPEEKILVILNQKPIDYEIY